MRSRVRLVAMGLVGALGMASALAIGAGADDVTACVSKSGVVQPAGHTGKCLASQAAITISGEAFKRGRNGTITINGVPFKRGSRRVITINGNSFRTGTLPNSLTINGNSFRTGTLPRSLTINGTSFRSRGNTLTINGTEFAPGVAQGPPGPQGPAGPSGLVAGPDVAEVAGPVKVASGTTGKLASVEFTSSGPTRVMVAGGFNLVCSPCGNATQRVTPVWQITLDGATTPLVSRRMTPLEDGESAGAGVSELITVPNACGPCTITLSLAMPATAGGGAYNADVSAIRAGILSLK